MPGNRMIEQGTEEEHDESYLAWPLSEGLSGPLRTGGRSNLRTLLCLVLAMLLQTGIVSTVAGQIGVPLPPRPPQLPDVPPPPRPPELDVPPPPPKAPPGESITAPRIFVKEVRFTGNSAFTAEQLSAVTAPYMNRELTAEDLEALRLGLTYFYINRGYVTSGALIPEQTVTDGVLTMQIVEGQLTEINVEGTNWFRPSYFQNRIRLAAGPPLNVNELQQRLQILQGDPRIKRINAELRPGLSRGDNTLNVNITEANPLKAWLEFNNYQSPTVGAEQGFVTVAHQNLLGFGDQLSLQYGRSAGVNPMLNFRYAIPVTARDTTVSFQYRRFDFTVTEDPFEELDIENNAEIFSLAVRHPVYRTLDQEFALSFGLDHEQNKSFLGGQPFEFIQGAPDGRFRITALRFGQEYTKRSSNQVIAALSRFSVGIGALDATTNGNPTFTGREILFVVGSSPMDPATSLVEDAACDTGGRATLERPFIPLGTDLQWEDGTAFEGIGSLR